MLQRHDAATQGVAAGAAVLVEVGVAALYAWIGYGGR